MSECFPPHDPTRTLTPQQTNYLVTFAKGDRIKASPSGDEDDVFAADVGPLLAMDVV